MGIVVEFRCDAACHVWVQPLTDPHLNPDWITLLNSHGIFNLTCIPAHILDIYSSYIKRHSKQSLGQSVLDFAKHIDNLLFFQSPSRDL
jgi:hypothetical protein